MKRIALFVLIGLTMCAPAYAQSACEQLGADCHIERHHDSDDGCDQECRAERHREAQKEDRERAEYNREVAQQNWERRQREKANELGRKAYALQQADTPPHHDECRKAIELYFKSLDIVDSVWQYYDNAATCADTIGTDPSTNQKDQSKYDQWAWGLFKETLKLPNLPAEERDEINWAMWKLQWRHGRRCPKPPAFNVTQGCVGNPDMPHDAYPYVPLPVIDGKNWTFRNFQMSRGGHFTITTTDGHVWNESDNLVNTPMMNSRFQTDAKTTVRLTLPDGHDFVISPGADITLDSFVYDPNENMTTVIMGNIKGLFRFVTGSLQKAFPQNIKLNLGQLGSVGIRGTDVEINEIVSPSYESPLLIIDVHDGAADFTDKTGRGHVIPRGYELTVILGRDGDTVFDLLPMNEVSSKVMSSFTDSWDMTPLAGRELQ